LAANLVGPDDQNHSTLAARTRILGLSRVPFGERIEMRSGVLFTSFDDLASDREVSIRIVGIGGRQRDSRVSANVLVFPIVTHRVHEDVLAIEINPRWCHVGSTIRE
jgi:hypothetical protein